MGKIEHLDTIARAIARAQGVQRKSLATFQVDYASRCEAPRVISRVGRPEAWHHLGMQAYQKSVDVEPGKNHALFLDMEVPCRRCASCLKLRAAHWRYRAETEIAESVRTWFATYTLSPHEQYLALLRARENCAARDVMFERLTEAEQFRARVKAISPEFTRYWKRVRKNSNSPKMKYFWVAEKHQTGLPHFHALVHEKGEPIRKAVLREAWNVGFSTFKLVEGKYAARYVCKYISKDAASVVRSSLGYGKYFPMEISKRNNDPQKF